MDSGHNHRRMDGGPELVGEEHDRWYPDCPLTGRDTGHVGFWKRLIASNRHDRNVSLVAEGIKRWRLQFDPADDDGPTMSEYLVTLLEQEGRLR